MGSDKSKALIAFAKLAVSVVAGYAIYWMWTENRAGLDEAQFGTIGAYFPYIAFVITAGMVFLMLSKLNKGGD